MRLRQPSVRPRAAVHFGTVLLVGNLLVLLTLAVTATAMLKASRNGVVSRSTQSAENLARTFALSIEADIRLVDNALLTAIEQADQLRLSTTDLDPRQLERLASVRKDLVPHAGWLRFVDARGRVVRTGGTVDVGDRDYFKVARDHPTRLIVSEPIEDRVDGRTGVVLARAWYSRDGTFRGVACAHLSSGHFVDKFKEVDIGPQGAVTLRSASLRLVARHTPGESMPSTLVGSAGVSKALQVAVSSNPVEGVFLSRTALDQIERVNAYQRIGDHPLTVLVGLGTADYLVPWHRQAREVAFLCVFLGTLVAALSVLAHRTHLRQLHVQREQLAMLENELVGMVRLRGREAVWHNAAFARLFGYEGQSLVGRSSRMLYPDDESFRRVGRAYVQLDQGSAYRAQIQMRHRDGHLLWIDLSGTRLDGSDSLWMLLDVTHVKESEARAKCLAVHDPLTGLLNRTGLEEALPDLCRQNERSSNSVALFYIDLDGFKAVNDQHGHAAGDALLKDAAGRISAAVRAGSVVARMGGDEFVAAVGQFASDEELQPVIDRLLHALSGTYALPGGAAMQLSASIGAAWVPAGAGVPSRAMVEADQAMYAAKHGGKNRGCIASHGSPRH